MNAAVLYGQEDVRVENVPMPPVGTGEVRVRIAAALTCGTDVKVYRRGYHARMITPPALFGHEFAGIVDEIGEGVGKWRHGMRVVAANSAPCEKCFFCQRSKWELCEDLLFINGAYAEYITLPKRLVSTNLYEISDALPLEQAALSEPLACVVRGMESITVEPDVQVVVLGLGPIGLMFVRMCRLKGARVIAVGRGSARLTLAEELGAWKVIDIDGSEDVVREVRLLTVGQRGPDIAIEAVGSASAWEQAIAMPRKAGVVCLFGGCPQGADISLDSHRVHYDELTLLGTFHHTPRTFHNALQLIESGVILPDHFLQNRASLADLPSVLARLASGAERAVKTVISPAS